MTYASLAACVADLERNGQLVRIDHEVDPYLEVGAIQRRAFRAKAPALLFTQVKGTPFPMLANLFSTRERLRFIFRDTLPLLEFLFQVKADPLLALKKPWKALGLPPALWHALPRRVRTGKGADSDTVLAHKVSKDLLPQLHSWPMDGGAFVTLPLVYSEHPDKPGLAASNLGMYRVQLSGNAYADDEVGVHYQIHRGIAEHHMAALRRGVPLPVNIFVGGPPAMTVSAVMPLPEGLSELFFAGALGGRRVRMSDAGKSGQPPSSVWLDADFCISGHLMPETRPEGPFGDHLGYYSLTHEFPALKIHAVTHRPGAIWPFTTVGRPPQEDTLFGEFIHELTGPLVPQVFSGVHEVHAVDATGVHPLLLALGSERYTPFAEERRPMELITCACNVLGTTQTALAKYCLMAAREDDRSLTTHDIPAFFKHMLQRTRFDRDLHFITRTTIDTLDYSGSGLNAGSKLIWVAAGKPCRRLGTEMPGHIPLPEGFGNPRMVGAGMLVISGPPDARGPEARGTQDKRMEELAKAMESFEERDSFPFITVVDDSDFVAQSFDNFLWVAFTRSDPATDIYGVKASQSCKHWSCEAPLLLDARFKPGQAPALEEDPEVEKRVDALAAKGGPLYGLV